MNEVESVLRRTSTSDHNESVVNKAVVPALMNVEEVINYVRIVKEGYVEGQSTDDVKQHWCNVILRGH
ncbi:hypothetical protein AKO1_000143 [Acrasis kona]|uniref:Uncharacterized protein n=1 Tax=Acrasis kona TaxID=1008807 RepID=A0AAW2ZN82_9EUKA